MQRQLPIWRHVIVKGRPADLELFAKRQNVRIPACHRGLRPAQLRNGKDRLPPPFASSRPR